MKAVWEDGRSLGAGAFFRHRGGMWKVLEELKAVSVAGAWRMRGRTGGVVTEFRPHQGLLACGLKNSNKKDLFGEKKGLQPRACRSG